MSNLNEAELELEEELHESELEGAGESAEGEGILGAIGSALGGLLGEEELEQHELHELHELHESGEAGELHELGGLHESELHELGLHETGLHEHGELHELGGLHESELHELGLHEAGLHEHGELHELHELHEGGLHEGGEQFFGRIGRGIGRFVKRAAPLLKQVARIAAPMVATAIGGPALGGIVGKLAPSLLGEEEMEQHEWESELHETGQHEGAHEVAHEIAHHETVMHEALAEMMAEAAAHEHNEAQAEAMVGAAAVSVISPADRRALRRILPHLVRGAAILTRILRRRRITRPAVRAVPTIMRRTVRTLKRAAAAGQPVTRRLAARAAASQVRRVLANPTACAAAISKNVAVNRRMNRPRRAAA
jgi:hypothetical protein